MSVFKASASFFKRLARHKHKMRWLKEQKLATTLRIATSCGEPLSPELHAAAARVVCPNLFNSYWSTEHGSRLKVAPTLSDDSAPCAALASPEAQSRPRQPQAAAQQLGRQRGLVEGDERGAAQTGPSPR